MQKLHAATNYHLLPKQGLSFMPLGLSAQPPAPTHVQDGAMPEVYDDRQQRATEVLVGRLVNLRVQEQSKRNGMWGVWKTV